MPFDGFKVLSRTNGVQPGKGGHVGISTLGPWNQHLVAAEEAHVQGSGRIEPRALCSCL